MCGILGSTVGDVGVLEGMCVALGHRGPDGSGVWVGSGIGLGHTRLAIIDLSRGGSQPMLSACGGYALAFNGEIYNYRELKRDLEAGGEVFGSSSDTEVLLRLLMKYGMAALDKLCGMFAFAFWDKKKGELFLVRDRLGVKPLVYARTNDGGLAFASEIAALRKHPGIDLGLDAKAVERYLACLYIPAPLSIHRGIRKLLPGHYLRFAGGELSSHCYWRPRYSGERDLSLNEAVEEVLPLLKDAVRLRLVADVEVGCFLSGGIDSSTIAALMAKIREEEGGAKPLTFTMTFAEKAYDEREKAQAVSNHIGSVHKELAASSKVVDDLPMLLERFGEPFGNPTALLISDLSRKAREYVKVALVGDGGDEVFGGYPRYQGGLYADKYLKVPAWLREGVIAPLAGFIPESSKGLHSLRRAREFLTMAKGSLAETYAAWTEYFAVPELKSLLALENPGDSFVCETFKNTGWQDPLNAMQETDLLSFLPYNILYYGDAMSMAHALELRHPLLDYRLVEKVGGLSARLRMQEGKKTLLKAAAYKLLPKEIIDMPKVGFNPPMGVWLGTNLKDMVKERLTKESLSKVGINWAPVQRLLAEQGHRDHSLKIWGLLVLVSWVESQ